MSDFINSASSIWFVGALIVFSSIALSTLRFRKKASFFSNVKDQKVMNILNLCRHKLNVSKPIRIFSGSEFEAPFIFGQMRPAIYLPKHILKEVNNRQLYHICLHELAHYKRKDLLLNVLGMLVVIIHWFNPLVWYAMKEMKTDRELACDNYVLEILGENQSVPYGMTIISLSQIVSKQHGEKIFCSYFFKNHNQIERRINMIKMFKQGSYKMSILTCVLLLILGSTVLTDAKGTKMLTSSLARENMEFALDSPHKGFYNLDRAMDFIDFELKVPDYLPAGYEFINIDIDKNNTVSINFEKNGVDPFCYKAAENNLLSEIMHSAIVVDQNFTIGFIETPMSVDHINGTVLTINKEHKYKDDKTDTTEKGMKASASTDKFFIWRDKDTWYSLKIYSKEIFPDSSSSKEELSWNEARKIVTSIEYPNELKNVNYISKPFENLLNIYDNEDLNTATKMLRFKPKFPLSLPGGFYPTHSQVGQVYYREKEKLEPSAIMETTFSTKKYTGLIHRIELEQTSDSFFYDYIKQNGSFKAKDLNTNQLKEIKIDSLKIDNVEILTYQEEYDFSIDSLLMQTIVEQCYLWKQGDIVYRAKFISADFIGPIENQHEILKSLINND